MQGARARPRSRVIKWASLSVLFVAFVVSSLAAIRVARAQGLAPNSAGVSVPTRAFDPVPPATPPSRNGNHEPIRVHVLTLSSEARFEDAVALTAALKRVLARASGWEPAAGEHSLDVWSATLDCSEPFDSICIDRIAAEIGAECLLWGTLSVQRGRTLVRLHQWYAGHEVSHAEIDYKMTLDDSFDQDLLTIADSLLGKLLGPLRYPVSVVALGIQRGWLGVDGVPSAELVDGSAELMLPSGKHRITLSGPSQEPLFQEVRVRLDRPNHLRFTVPRSAGADRWRTHEPHVRRTIHPQPQDQSGDRDSTVGYVSLGLGGALMLGAALALSGADERSDKGSAALPWVLLTAGVGTAAAGVYMVTESLQTEHTGVGGLSRRRRASSGACVEMTFVF